MGGGGGEGGGERARARPHLQLVRVLARHACAGRGGATAWTGRGGPAQRLQQVLGRVRFDPERTLVHDWNAAYIILQHYIATSHSITATTHAK